MVPFYGDFDTSETVYIPFNTFDSNDPSASVTITNLAATDIHVHKDGSVTQRTSTAGFTVTIDFDSITGNHMLALDLSDNTDAGFWANGSQYSVRMEGTTVDGATINAWIGSFSIGRTLRPTTAGRTLDVTATGAAGIDWGNVENPTTTLDLSATSINLCDTITTYTGNTVQTGDSFARLAAPAGASVSADIAAIKAETALIVADTNELQTDDVPGLIAALNDLSAAEVNTEVDSAIVTYGLDHLVQAAVIGTDVADNSIIAKMVSSSATADWDSYANTTDSLQATRDHIGDGTNLTEAGGTGDHLSAVPWNASWDAEVQSEVNDGLVAYDAATGADISGLNDPTAAAISAAVWDEDATGHQTTGTFGQAIGDPAANTKTLYAALVTDATGASVTADVATAQADLDTITGADGVNLLSATQASIDAIETDTNSLNDTKIPDTISLAAINAQVDTALSDIDLDHWTSNGTAVPAVTAGSYFDQLTDDGTAAYDRTTDSLQAIRDHATTIKSETALIVADTNELQTDWADAGRLDAILDARASQTTADAIETDTQDIQGRLPAALIGGRMDSDVEAINNNTTAAVQLALSANEIESGACEGTPSTTVIQTDLAETQDDIYIGRTVIFTSGNARGEATDITDYAGSTGTLTVTALANAPAAADTFILI